jgi:hypothetical protein
MNVAVGQQEFIAAHRQAWSLIAAQFQVPIRPLFFV